MFHIVKSVIVELNTAEGHVFTVQAEAVELRATEATIAINADNESYYTMNEATGMMLRVGEEFLSFALRNAAAKLRDGQLIIVAEDARRVVHPHEPTDSTMQPAESL
jgi:hypothetical protein